VSQKVFRVFVQSAPKNFEGIKSKCPEKYLGHSIKFLIILKNAVFYRSLISLKELRWAFLFGCGGPFMPAIGSP
jgi:hypothetical protein